MVNGLFTSMVSGLFTSMVDGLCTSIAKDHFRFILSMTVGLFNTELFTPWCMNYNVQQWSVDYLRCIYNNGWRIIYINSHWITYING